jgi:NO-binding membrane sensor protein with MHYT domain
MRFEVLIPITALLVAWGIAFVALHYRNRAQQLRHSERLTAIEKGIEPLPEPRSSHLLRGLVWLFVGLGISVFFAALYLAERDRDELAMTALGLIPIGVGAAYLIVYRVERKKESEK